MKRESGFFGDREVELIYMAKRFGDATKLESILTAGGVDYAVEAEEYQGGVVFRRMRAGAFFYVLPEAREHAVSTMAQAGYTALTLK